MADLQPLFDAIPLHRGQQVRVTPLADGVRFDALLGEESARSSGMDQVHGGMISALLDTAATFAMVAVRNTPWSTVDLRVDYLRPVALGPVSVVGTVVRAGKSVGRARAELFDADGRSCALAIGTFLA